MTVFKTRYIVTKQNLEIPASGSEVFGQDQASREANTKWGSFNFMTITSQSDQAITINLDDGSVRKFTLFANAAFFLDAAEGIFFDWIKVDNQSAVGVVLAAKLNITFGRSIGIPNS